MGKRTVLIMAELVEVSSIGKLLMLCVGVQNDEFESGQGLETEMSLGLDVVWGPSIFYKWECYCWE